MVLPAYSELERPSVKRFAWVSIIAIAIYTILGITLAILALLLFRSDVTSDLLDDMGTLDNSASVFCRLSYCLVLMLHLPYFIFATRD